MQTTAIPTINVSTPSQTKDASTIASTGTQSPTFQKVLNKEIQKEAQKETSGVKKTEQAQQNKSSKENKAPTAPENSTSAQVISSTASSGISKSEKSDSKIDEENNKTELPSDLLSYVQDLNQLFNAAATPVIAQPTLSGKRESTESSASGISSLDSDALTSLQSSNQATLQANKAQAELVEVDSPANTINTENSGALFQLTSDTKDTIPDSTFALSKDSTTNNTDNFTATANSKDSADNNSAISSIETEAKAKIDGTNTSQVASFSLNKQETSSSAELSNKELSIKDGVTNALPQIAATTNTADLRNEAVAPVQSHITQAIRSLEWNQSLGNKIIWMAQDGIQTAQLDLNPPDLGPLQIVLNISNENIDARFVSSHMEVRTAVEAAMPKLKEMMENNGLSLSGFNVSSQGSPQEQFQQQQEARNRLNQLDGTRLDKNATTTAQEIIVNRPKLQSSLGQVDTFV